MLEKELSITNTTGLHTRPANRFVKYAKQFQSEIHIYKGEKSGNAKSLVKILKMGISQGDKIRLTCEGPDEEAAMAGLTAFIDSLEKLAGQLE